jgi:hypothetical protein
VHWAPGIPRALCFRRAMSFWQTLGREPRREREPVSAV